MIPWGPDDTRWNWVVVPLLALLVLALMFGGFVFGQPGDPRPLTQTVPIMGIDTQGRLVLVGDLANHALRVSVVGGISLGNVTVISSVLPTGASTDASVQAIETAIREAQTAFGSTFPVSGQAVAAIDPSGNTASLSLDNSGFLKVNVAAGGASGGTSSNFGSPFPGPGTAAGFKDGAGRMASATVDNASNLFVIASQGTANSGQPWFATGTMTVHQGDTWTVSCSNCSGSSTTNYGANFPAAGLAMGVKDGAGRFASMTVDNASNLFVIASQSSSAWTVTATGTVTAHQGDTWTVQQGNPPWNIQGGAATGTQAAVRPVVMGGVGQSATVTQATICDNFATVTMGWQTGNQQIITGTAGQNVRICSMVLIAASATSISIIEGSGVLCNTNKSAVFGSSATINGLNLATNGGLTIGTGIGEIGSTQMTGNNVCIANSTSAVVSGGIKWTKF